jgi:GNAT superfamily N-acetyltransferase
MIETREPDNASDIRVVRTLFEEYQAELGVDLEFQAFTTEVAGLPGEYAPPYGRLLLASCDGQLSGCVALRRLASDDCEMKRLYVRPPYRALGLGRLLAQRVIDEARRIGYRRMFLDTLPSMGRAQRMYESLGFVDTEAYRFNPIAGTRYMVLGL